GSSPGTVACLTHQAVQFLRHHAACLSPSDRRMVASLLASYVGDDDAGDRQLEAIANLMESVADGPHRQSREYDGSPSGPGGRTFGEEGSGVSQARKSTGRRKK